LLAALALPAARFSNAPRRGPARIGPDGSGQITEDLRNLDIRPADPALQPNTEIYADPETLRKLADKLAAAESADHDHHGVAKLLDKARSFADAFQDKLNGIDHARNPTRMRLTDRNPGPPSAPRPNHANPGENGSPGAGNGLADNSQRGAAGIAEPDNGHTAPPPMTSIAPQQADQLAKNSPAGDGPDRPQAGVPSRDTGDPNAGGGLNHGSGADPASLYGPAGAQPLGSDSFKIAIEAEPSDESTAAGSPTYVPPRIRVPLNSEQYPDQPLARAAVPAADQNTIKRVFAR
jgi:hypothetical protein